jgi:hypothetical protein
VSEVAACARCTNEACSALVILPAVPDDDRRFDEQKHSMEIDCPVCHQPFSISFREIFLYEVTDDDLLGGYVVQGYRDLSN